ncbi:MAG: tRNA (cytidine32/uridine32-2'-O)-methyltransferase [Halieaceae bacterium]|jgi:tRNA (cytidine32/uridine32-2'-O)-methyltransferase
MKNMGLTRLVLVAPKQFPDEQATWRATAAVDVLENAEVVATLAEAVADCTFVIGTSARERRIPWPLLDPRQSAQRVGPETERGEVAVVFGREDRGLTNEELQLCHLHVSIPSDEQYSSLNLAMAVQIICYEMRMVMLDESGANQEAGNELSDWEVDFATGGNVERFFVHLEEVLVDLEFLDPAAPRQLMVRLRRLFQRVRMDEMEVNILRGILSDVQRWVARAKLNSK